MEKESKKSVEANNSHNTPTMSNHNPPMSNDTSSPNDASSSNGTSSPNDASSSNGTSRDPGFLCELGQEFKEQVRPNQGYLKIDYFTLFWLFVAGSIFGLVVETIFHAIVYGGLESRAGLVWGPFSPIYGVGAVVLTSALNRFYHSHNLVIFLVAMVLGSVIEYSTSVMMEMLWGAIAWDYTGTFGSINGRTNFAFGVMWGLLGLMWVRFVLPVIKRAFSHTNARSILARLITSIVSVFMITNIILTVCALDRESERANDIPATTWEQRFFDEHFPDSYLQARMQNMSVYGAHD